MRVSRIQVRIDGQDYEYYGLPSHTFISIEKSPLENGYTRFIGDILFYVAESFENTTPFLRFLGKTTYKVYWAIAKTKYADRTYMLTDMKSNLFGCPSQNELDRITLEFENLKKEVLCDIVNTSLSSKKKRKKSK
jgi:hypothetical protein